MQIGQYGEHRDPHETHDGHLSDEEHTGRIEHKG
jgi:hypothetical protein